MKLFLQVALLLIPAFAFAGALEDGAPLPANYNLSFIVLKQLTVSKYDQLRPHKIVDGRNTYSYYLKTFLFLGRAETAFGYRNLFYLKYIRSSSYDASDKSPAKGHNFLLCVKDNGNIEFYVPTDAAESEVILDQSILHVDTTTLDLDTDKGMKYFHEINPP
jgi:hypothetical protein